MEEKKEFGPVTRAATSAAEACDGPVRKGTDLPRVVHPAGIRQ